MLGPCGIRYGFFRSRFKAKINLHDIRWVGNSHFIATYAFYAMRHVFKDVCVCYEDAAYIANMYIISVFCFVH